MPGQAAGERAPPLRQPAASRVAQTLALVVPVLVKASQICSGMEDTYPLLHSKVQSMLCTVTAGLQWRVTQDAALCEAGHASEGAHGCSHMLTSCRELLTSGVRVRG